MYKIRYRVGQHKYYCYICASSILGANSLAKRHLSAIYPKTDFRIIQVKWSNYYV